jgi:carboxypeptidase Taq
MGRYKQQYVLRTANQMIHWDLETMMPPRGIILKSEQLGLMDVLAHKILVDPQIPKLLATLEAESSLREMDAFQKRNIELVRRYYDQEAGLPEDLVEALAKQQAMTIVAWKKAKAAKTFSMYRNELEQMIALKKKAAEIMMGIRKTPTPYDALIETFEPGMTQETIAKVFEEMKAGIMRTAHNIQASGVKPDVSFLSYPVPVEQQRKISLAAMQFIGYDTTSPSAGGRLDETEHPFTTGCYDDVRITTHYHVDRFLSSFYSVMHEGGHALYEQGIPHQWMFQPLGSASSYGVHESQSRFVENMVGRSPEFLAYILPILRNLTKGALKGVRQDDFVKAVNRVEPTKIRIDADEVTYGLHIIIRFEIERELFVGKIGVDDLPAVWNEKYEKYLGLKIENDSEGVMQDTHWAGGAFGYFPSYAMGNIYGGMFLEKMNKDLKGWRKSVKKGDFSGVKSWLTTNVHSKGDTLDPAQLVKAVTGRDVEVQPFIDYLDRKFSKIYGY